MEPRQLDRVWRDRRLLGHFGRHRHQAVILRSFYWSYCLRYGQNPDPTLHIRVETPPFQCIWPIRLLASCTSPRCLGMKTCWPAIHLSVLVLGRHCSPGPPRLLIGAQNSAAVSLSGQLLVDMESASHLVFCSGLLFLLFLSYQGVARISYCTNRTRVEHKRSHLVSCSCYQPP